MATAEVREFRAYNYRTIDELVQEVEQIALTIFLWMPPKDGSGPAPSWEALMAKQQAARRALIATVRAEEREKIVKALEAQSHLQLCTSAAENMRLVMSFVERLK